MSKTILSESIAPFDHMGLALKQASTHPSACYEGLLQALSQFLGSA